MRARDGFLHRYTPPPNDDGGRWRLGEYEGAFLPSTFWLATVRALAGRRTEAEAILDAVEARACEPGLFPEEIDTRTGGALGNTPLLFAHAEYIRAVLALNGQHNDGQTKASSA